MKNDSIKLGKIIKKIRLSKGMSQCDLAFLIGISSVEISRIERGIRKSPNLIILINICETLDIDIQKLLKDTGFIGYEGNKVFEILIEKTFTKLVKISSKSQVSALKSVEDFEKEYKIENLSPKINVNFHVQNVDYNDKRFREEMKKYIFSKNKNYKNYDLTDDIFVQNTSNY